MIDGHDCDAISAAIDEAKRNVGKLNAEQAARALEELKAIYSIGSRLRGAE